MRLPVGAAVRVFGLTMTAFDEVNSRNARGEGSRVTEADRRIYGVIQPAGDKLTALLPQGSQTAGAMVMHTSHPVTACDLSGTTGSTGRQTYIRHAGEIWRVWGIQTWAPHTSINRYLLTKHARTD